MPYSILSRDDLDPDLLSVRQDLCALAIMAKAPRAGKVKTRLSPPLTPEESAALNISFLKDTAENLAAVAAKTAEGHAAGLICYTPIGDEAAFDGLLPPDFALVPQRGDGFGERLLHAAQDILAFGFASVCLIDSDSPTVPRAAFEQAWIALRRTTLRAPVTGYVAQRSVQIGQQVGPGQPLLNVVPLNRLWVDANFKESQLRALRIGQPAELQADLYGSSFKFQGRVLGAAAGTGAAFSLLPAQNASGNWIKVVQRVPVRIGLDPQQLASHPLRIGLSIDVNVDTRDRSGNLLASTAANTPVATTALYAGDAAAAAHAADAIIHGDALEQP